MVGLHAKTSLYAVSGERKYLNNSERSALTASLAALTARERLLVRLIALSGCRISEALAVRPLSFQRDPGIVAFQTLKRRMFVVREVPLPADFLAELELEFDLCSRQADPHERGERLWTISRTTAWRTVKRAMAIAGLYGRAACPRGLRHSFGVSTTGRGIPLNIVSKWLGHASLETTAIYTDAVGQEEREWADRFWRG